jgi:trimethylamine:corrinoid methyltransferase-like protein
MLDFLACHSIEKLVIDAEAITSAQRLLEGIEPRGSRWLLPCLRRLGCMGIF